MPQQHTGAVEVLIGVLARAEEASNRIQAAKALAELGPEAKAAVPALIAALNDSDEQVRGQVVRALGRIGPDAAAAVGPLLEVARKERSGFVDISNAIVQIGKPAVPALVAQATKSPPWSSQSRYALFLLGDLGPKAREAVPALADLLRDEVLAFLVAKTLLKIDPENANAIATLLEVMRKPSDVNDDLRAAEVLIHTKRKKEVLPFLIKALPRGHKDQDEEPWQVAGIAMLLWELGPEAKQAAPVLAKRLKEVEPRAEPCLIHIAGPLLKIDPGNQVARDTLLSHISLLKDNLNPPSPVLVPETLFTIEVATLLGRDAKQLIPRLEQLLNSEYPEIREAAERGLKVIRGDKK